MKVTKDTVVRLSVEMDGDSGGRELEYLHGGYGSLFPKLEAALAGLEAGGKANVTLSPADGFGEHDPSLIRREPRERLPQGVKVGSALLCGADGRKQSRRGDCKANSASACRSHFFSSGWTISSTRRSRGSHLTTAACTSAALNAV